MQIKQKAKASVARSKKGILKRRRERGARTLRIFTQFLLGLFFPFSRLRRIMRSMNWEAEGVRGEEAEVEYGACCQLHLIEWTGGRDKDWGGTSVALPFFALANLNSCTNVRSCHFLEPGPTPCWRWQSVKNKRSAPLLVAHPHPLLLVLPTPLPSVAHQENYHVALRAFYLHFSAFKFAAQRSRRVTSAIAIIIYIYTYTHAHTHTYCTHWYVIGPHTLTKSNYSLEYTQWDFDRRQKVLSKVA